MEFILTNIQIKDLEEDIQYHKDENCNLLREITEGKHSSHSSKGISVR